MAWGYVSFPFPSSFLAASLLGRDMRKKQNRPNFLPACFNITTGDVEDAPALNALNKYEIIEKDDGVYIEAEESDIKSGHRDPALKCSVSSDSDERVLIVGGYVDSLNPI